MVKHLKLYNLKSNLTNAAEFTDCSKLDIYYHSGEIYTISERSGSSSLKHSTTVKNGNYKNCVHGSYIATKN